MMQITIQKEIIPTYETEKYALLGRARMFKDMLGPSTDKKMIKLNEDLQKTAQWIVAKEKDHMILNHLPIPSASMVEYFVAAASANNPNENCFVRWKTDDTWVAKLEKVHRLLLETLKWQSVSKNFQVQVLNASGNGAISHDVCCFTTGNSDILKNALLKCYKEANWYKKQHNKDEKTNRKFKDFNDDDWNSHVLHSFGDEGMPMDCYGIKEAPLLHLVFEIDKAIFSEEGARRRVAKLQKYIDYIPAAPNIGEYQDLVLEPTRYPDGRIVKRPGDNCSYMEIYHQGHEYDRKAEKETNTEKRLLGVCKMTGAKIDWTRFFVDAEGNWRAKKSIRNIDELIRFVDNFRYYHLAKADFGFYCRLHDGGSPFVVGGVEDRFV